MKNNYTFSAIRIANKYPLLTNIIKQVIFWIIAFSLLVLIIHLNTLSIFKAIGRVFDIPLGSLISFVIFAGLSLGVSLGLVDGFLEKNYFKNRPLGISILIGGLLYFIVLIGIVTLTRKIFLNYAGVFFFNEATAAVLEKNWKYYYFILLTYTFFMTLVMSFINQMSKKFGPGILLPFLLGKFRYPREEERIFMFLDLQSSTKLAEKLGHIKYSSLIQDCFLDINKQVKEYNAEIYQYVGDGIIVSWPLRSFRNLTCIDFFFSVQQQFNSRKEFYENKYNTLPFFKAGVHQGMVTAVEVGDVKRDIAYHGDTLNVAARLEKLCSTYSKPILISEAVKNLEIENSEYKISSLGFQSLAGRESKIEVFSICKA